MRIRSLDVRALEPPEPLHAAIAALRELGDDEQLLLLHRREPHPLYALLPELGFDWRVEHQGHDVLITITRVARSGGPG